MWASSTTTTAPPSPSRGVAAALLAHEGGWDEILLVAGPIVVLGALLWLANRRADRMAAERGDDRK